jgi:hypothetical protein
LPRSAPQEPLLVGTPAAATTCSVHWRMFGASKS